MRLRVEVLLRPDQWIIADLIDKAAYSDRFRPPWVKMAIDRWTTTNFPASELGPGQVIQPSLKRELSAQAKGNGDLHQPQ